MVLNGCIGVIQVEGQFGQSEHGGLELHGVLGIAYCSRSQEGGMEAEWTVEWGRGSNWM